MYIFLRHRNRCFVERYMVSVPTLVSYVRILHTSSSSIYQAAWDAPSSEDLHYPKRRKLGLLSPTVSAQKTVKRTQWDYGTMHTAPFAFKSGILMTRKTTEMSPRSRRPLYFDTNTFEFSRMPRLDNCVCHEKVSLLDCC